MTTATSAARTRRYRARLRGLPDPTAPQPCPACGRLVRSRRTAPLCSRCWRRTPEAREANRLRMAAHRLTMVAGGGIVSKSPAMAAIHRT
jgi:hypothetical protein